MTSNALENSLIVITCAAGKQGRRLIPLLYNLPRVKLRLNVNSDTSHSHLSTEYPEAEVLRADLTDRSQTFPLLHNATHVYHVGPPAHEHETMIGYNVIDATVKETQRSGQRFRHFVYSSVLCTQLRKLLNHDCKRYVEEYLIESPLNYTILKPTDFMYPPAMVAAQPDVERPVVLTLWSPEAVSSFIALRDLADAAKVVLMGGEVHYMAEYPLCSTRPLRHSEAAAAAGRGAGKQIDLKHLSYEDGWKTLNQAIFHQDRVSLLKEDVTQRLVLYYDRRGLKGNPNVLTWLLGRAPTSIEEETRLLLQEQS